MNKTIITLAALLALTTSSWAIEPEPLPDIGWFENYGRSLADRAVKLEFQSPEQIANIILSQAQKASGGFIREQNTYAHYAARAFDNRLQEIYGAKDTGAKDPAIEKWLREHHVSDEDFAPQQTPIVGFSGEPGEVIAITEGSQWVAPYPSGTYFFEKFQVKNRKGAVESSEIFNVESPQNRADVKQEFIQKLEKAGWQRLEGDQMRWKGL